MPVGPDALELCLVHLASERVATDRSHRGHRFEIELLTCHPTHVASLGYAQASPLFIFLLQVALSAGHQSLLVCGCEREEHLDLLPERQGVIEC